jgi:hypothetical protein
MNAQLSPNKTAALHKVAAIIHQYPRLSERLKRFLGRLADATSVWNCNLRYSVNSGTQNIV